MIWTPPPEQTFYNLDVAYSIARDKLAAANVERQCLNSGAAIDKQKNVRIDFLYDNYSIDIASGAVNLTSAGCDVPLLEKILILHYFLQAKGSKLTGTPITYRQLPGGLIYYSTFVKRTVKYLVDYFGNKTKDLIIAGKKLGVEIGSQGDASLIIKAFPRVPVNLVLWQGDDELSPQLNILFDANIADYLEPEDVTITCEIIARRLIAAAGIN